MSTAESPLKLGIPKGSLEKSTIELFAKAGWRIQTSGRSYFPSIDDPAIRCSLMRPQEMSRYIESGFLDGGVTGQDWIVENDSRVHTLCDLVYSKVSLQGTRWVLVVREDSPVRKPEDLAGARIATELVHVTRRFFADRSIDVDVQFSWGATEVKVPEMVDAIVDLTETGNSIRANKLRIVDTILHTSTRLIANKDSWENPFKRAKIERIALLLQAALEADKWVGLKLNILAENKEKILNALPALRKPTISPLSEEGWIAIETIVEEKVVREIIPELRDHGAEGIIEYPLNKVVH